MRLLYLGTNPKRYQTTKTIVHQPLIQIEPISILPKEIDSIWAGVSHILFTSPNAVHCWSQIASFHLDEKEKIAIGIGTADALQQIGQSCIQAAMATQEGVIETIRKMEISFLLWPHSLKSRPVLQEFLKEKKIPFYSFALYQPVVQIPHPILDLNEFDEIVFTSPSVVDAFFEIYKIVPRNIKLTAIGSVTEKYLFLNFLN